MRRVYKNLCPPKISASIMAANMWKNSLKNVESDNSKIFKKTYSIFLQRNGTHFLNKPHSVRYEFSLWAQHLPSEHEQLVPERQPDMALAGMEESLPCREFSRQHHGN
jgi:hypothetical protein